MPKDSLRQEQKRDRRERIFSEAMRLFHEGGFSDTTVTAIAKAAGVSRGTFFNYYPYKEAILLEYAAESLRGLESFLASEDEGLEPLYRIFDELALFVEMNRPLILPLLYEVLNPDPERSRVAFRAVPLVGIFGEVIRRGRERGAIRDDFSRERLARTLADAFFLNALQWAAYHPERSIRDELRKTLRLTLEGMQASNPVQD